MRKINTIKNTKIFSIGDSVEVNGETGVVEWVNLRNEYCINTKYEKDIYVYRRGMFVLLKDIISERKYLNVPLPAKHKKNKKSKKNQQMPAQKKKKSVISEYCLKKLCADNKKSKKEKELEAKVETYFTRQRQTEDLFVLWNRLPGSYGSRQ